MDQLGNTQRSEYTLIGDEVNLATRLMQVAEAKRLSNYGTAELVCDESTYLEIDELSKKGDLLARQLSFGQKKAVKVKGKTGLVEIYEPHMKPWIDIVRKPYSSQNKGTLVGRREEMDQIRDLIREVDAADRNHKGQLIVVEGEAGMGKTFFIGEIQRQAENNSGRILIGGGQRLQQTCDYHTWKPIFQQLYVIESQDNVELRMAKVLANLPYMPGERGYPALARDLSSLLNPVLSVRFPETPTTRQLDPGTRKRIRKDFLLRLLQIAAAPRSNREKAARFIIIEDVQWMDKASWDLTLEVLDSVRPLLLLLTMRPLNSVEKRQLPKSAGLVLNNKEAAWIRLEGFTSEQINKLVSQSIGVNEISSYFIEFLQKKTGGHPQLCKELAINLREKGLIDESSSKADLNLAASADDHHVVPIEIHKSVIGRIDQLSAAQQMILKIATLAEQPFTAEIIRKAYPIKIDEGLIGRHMDDLKRMRFLRHAPTGSGERLYKFDNTIVRDELRSLLPNKQKSEIQSLITMAS